MLPRDFQNSYKKHLAKWKPQWTKAILRYTLIGFLLLSIWLVGLVAWYSREATSP